MPTIQDMAKDLQEKLRRAQALRNAALTMAKHQHGGDPKVAPLLADVDKLAAEIQKKQKELQGLNGAFRAARLNLEQALEPYLPKDLT